MELFWVAQNSSDRQLLNSREQLDGDFLTNGELSSDADEEELEIYRHQRQAQHSLTPNEMLRSSTFYFLFAALFCCSFYGNMFYNLYKVLFLFLIHIFMFKEDFLDIW